MNPELQFIGLLPNLVEATPYQRANLAQLVTSYAKFLIALPGDSVRYAFVPARTAIAEAQACGSPLWQLRYSAPSAEQGAIDPKAMPLRTAAREAWREVRPVFDEIERQMGMGS
jgi:chromosome partitioning protein